MLRITALGTLLGVLLTAQAHGQDNPPKVKTRKFTFTYAGTVKELKPATQASIWLPLPTTTAEQEASIFSKELPGDSTIHQEKQFGNKMLFFKPKAYDQGEIPFKVTYTVLRREVRTDRQGTLVVEPRPKENIERFLLLISSCPLRASRWSCLRM